MKKYTITEITEWEEDSAMIAGDASHEGDRRVQTLLESERVNKIDNGVAMGLPFACKAENVDDAIEQYNDAHCRYDYLKAVEAEFFEEV